MYTLTVRLILAVTAFILAAVIVKQRTVSPLKRYPGPFWASLSRAWYTYVNWQGKQHRKLPALHERYGNIVRVAPNELHLRSREALQTIYGLRSECRKSDWFRVFQGQRQFDLISERDRRRHHRQRRLVSSIYSATSLCQNEATIDCVVRQLFEILDQSLGKPFDISSYIQYWSFDALGMVTFSKSFGFLTGSDETEDALMQIRSAADSAAWVGQNPRFYRLLEYIWFPIFGNPFGVANRNGKVRQFAVAQVGEREGRKSEQSDILCKLFNLHYDKPCEFNIDALRSVATTTVFAGAETITSSVRAAIYFLAKNPRAQSKLQLEVDEMCAKHEWPADRPMPLKLTNSMEYLRAVIYESMRLFPANGSPSARVAPPQGLTVDGEYFPGGTLLTVYAWSLHRNPDIFGEDAADFRPERWLEDKSTEFSDLFFSFGFGARACLGRNLAWMEMTKLISSLFRRYNVTLEDPHLPWMVEGGMFKFQKNIRVVLSKRELV